MAHFPGRTERDGLALSGGHTLSDVRNIIVVIAGGQTNMCGISLNGFRASRHRGYVLNPLER